MNVQKEKKSKTNLSIKKRQNWIFENNNEPSNKKIINKEKITKEPPHENSINPYRIKFN
jgi:hypothetical protein